MIDVVGIDHRQDDDYYSQPRLLFRLMTAGEGVAKALGIAVGAVV